MAAPPGSLPVAGARRNHERREGNIGQARPPDSSGGPRDRDRRPAESAATDQEAEARFSIAATSDNGAVAAPTGAAPFQLLPPLSAEELSALEADVVVRGIVVPVVVDQHGRLLDGHHRRAIANRLGIPCPSEVRQVADDEDARQTALALNLSRRHLSREQRHDLITRECAARPLDSDRAIARRLGCSPSTVGAVRRPLVSKLDSASGGTPLSREQAEQVTAGIRARLDRIDDRLLVGLVGGVDPRRLAGAVADALGGSQPTDGESSGSALRSVLQPRIDALLAHADGAS